MQTNKLPSKDEIIEKISNEKQHLSEKYHVSEIGLFGSYARGEQKNRSDIDILIEGHTDNLPIRNAVYRDNWDLSVARATSIVRILVDEYKISAVRLTASGKGEFAPKATNSTPEGRAKNRRTEIILSPKLDIIMGLIK